MAGNRTAVKQSSGWGKKCANVWNPYLKYVRIKVDLR